MNTYIFLKIIFETVFGSFLGMQRRIRLDVTHPKDRMVVVSQVVSVSVGDIVLRHQQGSSSNSSSGKKSESENVSDDSSSVSANQSSCQSANQDTSEEGCPPCLQLIIIKQSYIQVTFLGQ